MTLRKKNIEQEKSTIEKMIKIYCRQQHASKQGLCQDCSGLLEYARKRLDLCKYGDNKPTCEKCPIHCYKPEMREKVKKIMRYSGPRMIFFHPVEALRHMLKNFYKIG